MRVVLPLPQRKNSSNSSSSSSPSAESISEVVAATESSTTEDQNSNHSSSLSQHERKLETHPKHHEVQSGRSTEQQIFSEKKKPAVTVKSLDSVLSPTLESFRPKHSASSNLKTNSSSVGSTTYFSKPSATASGPRKKTSTASVSSTQSSSSTSRKRKHSSSSSSSKLQQQTKVPPTLQTPINTSKKHSKMTQGTGKYSSSTPNSNANIGASNCMNVNISNIQQENYLDTEIENENENDPVFFPFRENYNPNSNLSSGDFRSQRNHYNTHSNEHQKQQPQPFQAFQKVLKERKLEMVEQEGDGNCLFRAVSLQVYGDSSMHGEVRRKCLDFMAKDEEHFSQFIIGEPFQNYIRRKRIDGVHGNNPEIQAISELFNRPVEVFVPENGAKPINIFHAEYKTSDTPIRLSYHDGNHYNAVIDPLCPTAGLGLGLPGLDPGLADRMQLKTAAKENLEIHEKYELDKVREESMEFQMKMAMMESAKYDSNKLFQQKAIALSDLEATDFDLQQMVLANSLKSYHNSDQIRKQSWPNRGGGGSKRRTKSNAPSPTFSNTSSSFASRPLLSSSATVPTRHHNYPDHPLVAAPASASIASSIENTQTSTEGEEEYPQVVQELVMNGFELSRVIHAYDLVGNNFDDLLAFLMSSGR